MVRNFNYIVLSLFTLSAMAETLRQNQTNSPLRIVQNSIVFRDWDSGDVYNTAAAQIALDVVAKPSQSGYADLVGRLVKIPTFTAVHTTPLVEGSDIETIAKATQDKTTFSTKFEVAVTQLDKVLDTEIRGVERVRVTIKAKIADEQKENQTKIAARTLFGVLRAEAYAPDSFDAATIGERTEAIKKVLDASFDDPKFSDLFHFGRPYEAGERVAIVHALASGYLATRTQDLGPVKISENVASGLVYQLLRSLDHGLPSMITLGGAVFAPYNGQCGDGSIPMILPPSLRAPNARDPDALVVQTERLQKLAKAYPLALGDVSPLEVICVHTSTGKSVASKEMATGNTSIAMLQAQILLRNFRSESGVQYHYVHDLSTPVTDPAYKLEPVENK